VRAHLTADVGLIAGLGPAFGTPLPTHWAAIAVALVFGAASFCALGVAVPSFIRNPLGPQDRMTAAPYGGR
jgi:hypothetical protein